MYFSTDDDLKAFLVQTKHGSVVLKDNPLLTIQFAYITVHIVGLCRFSGSIRPDTRFIGKVALTALSWLCNWVSV